MPGGVWHVAFRLKMNTDAGVSLQSTAVVTMIEMASAVVSALIMSIPALALGIVAVSSSLFFITCVSVSAAILITWLLRRKMAVISHMLSAMHQHGEFLTTRSRLLLWASAISIFGWLASGCSLLCLMRSMNITVSAGQIGTLSSLASASWLAGFVTIWAPGGIGVREAVLASGLHGQCPVDVVVLIVVLARLAIMSADVVLAAVSYVWLKLQDGVISGASDGRVSIRPTRNGRFL